MSTLPHTSQPICRDDLTASFEMRAWMERDWRELAIGSTYTAIDYDEINATQSAVITMPLYGRVKVNNIDGSIITVNFIGGQTIFGDSCVQIHSKGSVIFKHLIASNQWVFE